MVVSFTPNIGLAKPSESEVAENWVNSTKLCEDNNLIIADKMDVNITSYSPTFVCTTTNPNVGAGSIQAEYCEVQGFIWGNFVIRFLDPGISSGTGSGGYGLSLPFDADASYHTVDTALTDNPGTASCIGEGHIVDISTVGNTGTIALDIIKTGGVTYARFITETFAGKTVRFFTPGQPFSFANNDRITGQFFYKKA